MVTPVLVSSQSPSAWALFGYLAIVLVANVAVARLRDWKFLAAAGFVGIGLWNLVYLASAGSPEIAMLVFVNAVTLARSPSSGSAGATEAEAAEIDWPSILPAVFAGITGLALLADPQFFQRRRGLRTGADGGARRRRVLPAGGAAAVFMRRAWRPSLPMHASLLAAPSSWTRSTAASGPSKDCRRRPYSPTLDLDRRRAWPRSCWSPAIYSARRLVAAMPVRAAVWAAWGDIRAAGRPVGSFWITFGNLDHDFGYAAAALAAGRSCSRRAAS